MRESFALGLDVPGRHQMRPQDLPRGEDPLCSGPRELDADLVQHDVALGKTRVVDGVVSARAQDVGVTVDLPAGHHIERMQHKDDVQVEVSEHVGDLAVAVYVSQIVPGAYAQLLVVVRDQRDGLLRPVRLNGYRLSCQHGVDLDLADLRLGQ